ENPFPWARAPRDSFAPARATSPTPAIVMTRPPNPPRTDPEVATPPARVPRSRETGAQHSRERALRRRPALAHPRRDGIPGRADRGSHARAHRGGVRRAPLEALAARAQPLPGLDEHAVRAVGRVAQHEVCAVADLSPGRFDLVG